jgi:hypothetical protein
MRDELKAAWDGAFDHPGEKFPVGRAVVCDICDKDWTDDPRSGGFLFVSKAYCPDCAVEGLRTIKKYKEERYIVAICGGESFADFVRRMRGPDAFIRVTVDKLFDDTDDESDP